MFENCISATDQEKTATNPVNTLDKPTSPQSSMNSFVINEAVSDAEVRWSLAVVLKKYPLSSCSDIKKLFQEMFKDSKIAEKFTCGSTKCSYIINFGIAPYFRLLLQDALNNAPYYVCSFDECYYDVIKKGQMDVHTRFWHNSTDILSTRYFNYELLGKAVATDVHAKFEICVSSLDSNKMIQVYIFNSFKLGYFGDLYQLIRDYFTGYSQLCKS